MTVGTFLVGLGIAAVAQIGASVVAVMTATAKTREKMAALASSAVTDPTCLERMEKARLEAAGRADAVRRDMEARCTDHCRRCEDDRTDLNIAVAEIKGQLRPKAADQRAT